jgi:hypothetical protein
MDERSSILKHGVPKLEFRDSVTTYTSGQLPA